MLLIQGNRVYGMANYAEIIKYYQFLIILLKLFFKKDHIIQMPTNSYISIIKICVQIFFLLQSIVLMIPSSFYRLLLRLFNNKNCHFNPLKQTHGDVFKANSEIMKVQNFRITEHECLTVDNAYVTFWRIEPLNDPINQDNKQGMVKKKPVLIQHGLLDCAMSWFLHQNPQKTLPYLLAKQGYDVWVGNNRGTKYSRRNSQNDQYWQYSLDHLIEYDIPAMTDHILQQTRQQKLIYIGHSQGTTQFLSAFDVHSELGSKIQSFIGFGPIISLRGLDDHLLIKLMDRLRVCEILKFIGFKAMFIIPNWMSKLIGVLIYNSWFYFKGFFFVVNGLCGKNMNKSKINADRFGVIISHEPGGSSINNVLHWIQIYRRGYLHKYDYGKVKNMEIYGSIDPPQYTYNNLKYQQFDFHLFRGTSDKVITENDFQNLTSKLNPQKYHVHLLQDYAHLDYIWCEDANVEVYTKVLKLLKGEKIQNEF